MTMEDLDEAVFYGLVAIALSLLLCTCQITNSVEKAAHILRDPPTHVEKE
jgi:hypothetical protein